MHAGQALNGLSLTDVCEAIVAQYQTETNWGQYKEPAQQANMISAIKCKCSNPGFNKQENQQQFQPSSSSSSKQSSNQQQWKQHRARGSGEKTGRRKQATCPFPFHLCYCTSSSLLTYCAITHIGSSSMTQCVVSEPTPPARTPDPYSLTNNASMLTEHLEVKPTIQTLKMLEQSFGEFDGMVRIVITTI